MVEITRREAVLGAAAVTLMAGRASADPETARGRVREESGAGIADIMVSNGRDVVLSGADGGWSMPVRAGDVLFVVKPAAWETRRDPVTQLAHFYRIHAPDGSALPPDARFQGLSPTGALPASIDFVLTRADAPPKFNVLLLTDPQPESLTELGYIRDDVIAAIAGEPGLHPHFGITHGDLMFDDLSVYDRYNRIVGSLGVPWYNVSGNHDMNFEAAGNAGSRETFQRVFGPRHHAFQFGRATFFILDNVEYLGTDPAKPNGFGAYRGRFGAEQLGFVRAVLEHVPPDSLVVYSFHIPLRTHFGDEPANTTTDLADFLAAIGTHPNSVSFAGHTHTNEHHYFGHSEGFVHGTHHHHILSAVSGSWWSGPFDARGIPVALASDGAPNGFHLLLVDGDQYSTVLVPAHEPASRGMRIMLDSQLHRGDREVLRDTHPGALLTGPISTAALGSTRLVVNLFDGGPNSTVGFRLMGYDTGEIMMMHPAMRTDPFVEEVFARAGETKKPWVQPVRSSHVWQARLPPDLPAGTYRVEVEAIDEHQRVRSGAMVLEVIG